MMHSNSCRFVCVAAFALMSVEANADQLIKNVTTRKDLADYCSDGVSTEALGFQDSTGPFYASRDLTIAGMYVNWQTPTVELAADRVITLTGNLYGKRVQNFSLKGGVYDFQNTYDLNAATYDCNKNGMILDGTVFTNMSTLVLKNGSLSGDPWQMKNGARIHGTWSFRLANGPVGYFLLNMESGSQISCVWFETDDRSGDYPRTLQLAGEGTRLYASNTYLGKEQGANKIGNKGEGNSVIVSDHANLTLSGKTYIGTEATSMNNTLRVSDSATAQLDVVYLGCNGGASNRVEVLSEATLTASQIYLNGGNTNSRDNLVAVSNATVIAARFFSLFNKGYGTTVRLSGDHPQILVNAGMRQGASASNAAEFRRNMTLVFDLPDEGYREGVTPIVITGTILDEKGEESPIGTYGDDTFRIRFGGIEEMQKRMGETDVCKRVIPLIACDGAIGYTTSVMDDANAQLPEGARLYKDNVGGKNNLLLEVKIKRGLSIIVR